MRVPMKVLIVDDSSQMRGMMRQFLPSNAGEIYECEDGIDALEYYEKFLPDWVLMDWEMKQMNGLEATKQINGKFPEAKILLVTQYNDGELREAASEAGAYGLVLKEDLAELRRLLAAPVEPPPIISDGKSGRNTRTKPFSLPEKNQKKFSGDDPISRGISFM